MVGIPQDTLREYLEQYKSGGIEALKVLRLRKLTSPLKKYLAIIEEDFKKNPPATLNEAAFRIENLIGSP